MWSVIVQCGVQSPDWEGRVTYGVVLALMFRGDVCLDIKEALKGPSRIPCCVVF